MSQDLSSYPNLKQTVSQALYAYPHLTRVVLKALHEGQSRG